jgi:hypothetical protein
MPDKIEELRDTLEELYRQLALFETAQDQETRNDTRMPPQLIHELCETFARQIRDLMHADEIRS